MKATIQSTAIEYNGRMVSARTLTVASEIKMDLNSAWEKVKTSALLEFVAKGMVTFKPTGGRFPEIWQEGSTVTTRMFLYGFIPFGGVHTLYVEKIDDNNTVLSTREFDNAAKVWNHKVTLKKITETTTCYEDEIIIYGGILTAIITWWAKSFYMHRQRRWQLLSAR